VGTGVNSGSASRVFPADSAPYRFASIIQAQDHHAVVVLLSHVLVEAVHQCVHRIESLAK